MDDDPASSLRFFQVKKGRALCLAKSQKLLRRNAESRRPITNDPIRLAQSISPVSLCHDQKEGDEES
jgi:hypothetical protein